MTNSIQWCRPNERREAREARLRALGFDEVSAEQREDNAAVDRLMSRRVNELGERRMVPAPCPVVCSTCTATSEAPIHTGWQWCALRDAWYCPRCGIPALPPEALRRYVCGLRAGYADYLGGVLAPEDGYPGDPWFVRGVKRGRESAGKDKPEAPAKPRLVRNEDLPEPSPLTDEDVARLRTESKAWREAFPTLTTAQIDAAIKQGERDRDSCAHYQHAGIDGKLRF